MKIAFLPFIKLVQFLIILLIVKSNSLSAQNILVNGDFESGGSGMGFLVHDYTLINPLNGSSAPGNYARTTNPNLMNSGFNLGGDHTTGNGNMIVVDDANVTNRFFWTTGNTGGAISGFTIGTTYTFSYWIKSVSNQVTNSATQANIGVFFVNATTINPTILNNLAPLPFEGWKQVSYSFVATANNVMVRLRTINSGALGNDFAVDDFSITQGGLPFIGSFTSVNPSCPNTTDGAISVTATGGLSPYSAYTLSGSATQSNTTGIFIGLTAGTYAISVTDASGALYSQSNIVLSIPNDLVLSPPTPLCAGDTTQLSVSGGDGSYTWTANPNDSSIVNPNSATQNVTPQVTTTYTVTSGTLSSPTNLIFNGDFSQGNISFTTDYTQVANPNPFGVQSSYAIVQNPNAWFTPFSSCGDHTSGAGNMMVVDGSTDPTGTIRVWCTAIPVAVLPNKSYTFSYYIASVAPENPARIQVTINGVSLGTPVTAPATTCLWTLQSYVWNSGSATTADICIFDIESAAVGNDFALDDISLVETPTCLYQKSVTVTVNQRVTPTFAAIAPICLGDIIIALPTTSINGYIGVWSPALNPNATTTYTFTPTSGQCASTTNLTIDVNPLPQFTVTQGCQGASYVLTAEVINATNPTFAWFNPSNNQIGSNSSSVVITSPGLYHVTVTQNGCSVTEMIQVVSSLCDIQKGISPNNDGLNDNFDLAGFNVSNLKIVNRYGTTVYDKSEYEDEWYGQSNNGNDLPDGTYYYVIDFADLETKTGWIYIHREQ